MNKVEMKKEAIYNAILKQVSSNGIGRINSKLLAKEAGVSEGTIFFYYKTIKDLLDYCAKKYDRMLIDKCFDLISDKLSLFEIWDILIEFLLENPDGANFYFAYVYYYGFNPTEANERANEFLSIAKELFIGKEHLTAHNILIYWDFITTQLFYYVNKISNGYLNNTKENKEFIKKLVIASYNVI